MNNARRFPPNDSTVINPVVALVMFVTLVSEGRTFVAEPVKWLVLICLTLVVPVE